MVKKILPVLILGTLLTGLMVPVLVFAQNEPQACCELRHDVKIGGRTFLKGAVLGEKGGACKKATLTGGVITVDCSSANPLPGSSQCYVKEWGAVCMFNTIYSATNWLFMILVLLSVLMIIYGGFAYVTASGDPEKATKGGKIITYALIGLAIALFAKVIPSIIRFIMGL